MGGGGGGGEEAAATAARLSRAACGRGTGEVEKGARLNLGL